MPTLTEADVRVSLWGVEVTERVASVTWTRGGCYEPGVILRGTKANKARAVIQGASGPRLIEYGLAITVKGNLAYRCAALNWMN